MARGVLRRVSVAKPRLPGAVLLLGAVWLAPGRVACEEPRPSHTVAHTATGTLTAYAPETRLIRVASAGGSSEFTVATDARVWLGSRRLSVRQLPQHLGEQVTVSWSEADGVRTTHTVRLLPAPVARK